MTTVDTVDTVEFRGVHYATFHGAPFDRGSADSYYSRPEDPHWYPDGTYNGVRVDADKMTEQQIAAYRAGYALNEESGDRKEW